GKFLTIQLDNQGILDVQGPTSFDRSNVVHTNAGTITITGSDLALNNSALTNTGFISVGVGRTFTIANSTFLENGSLSAPGLVSIQSSVAQFSSNLNTVDTTLLVNDSVINGPGTITNDTSKTITLRNSTINAPWVNQGLLIIRRVTFNGGLTTTPTSTIRVQGDNSIGDSRLTVAGNMTNLGLIEVTSFDAGHNSGLILTSGTLTNLGTIRTLAG